MVTLTCSSTESTLTVHRWSIRVPQCLTLSLLVRDETLHNITTGNPSGINCPSGIQFQATGITCSPSVSRLTTTTAPDGTTINCGNNAETSSDVRITARGN